jgi:hypothetical protein
MRKIIFIALAAAVSACSSKGTSKTDSAAGTIAAIPSNASPADSGAVSAVPPNPVVDVGTYGEDLYDEAKASHWPKATSYMDSLDAAAKALPNDDRIATRRAELTGVLDTLRRAVAGKQRQATLEASNRVTYLAAKMSEPYKLVTPADVVLLDYYGRELEIWAAQKNQAKLAQTAAEIRRTWDAVKPAVVSHGGAAAAAKADSLVARIEAAKSPAEYARAATPFLNVVDELEKPFTKQ